MVGLFLSQSIYGANPFQNYLFLKNTFEFSRLSVVEYKEQKKALREELRRVSLELAKRTLFHGFDFNLLKEILSESEQDQFFRVFNPVLYNKTLEALRTIDSPTLKPIVKKYLENKDKVPFRLIDFEDSDELQAKRGGFHKKTGIFVMNPSKVQRLDWLFVFIHELFHAEDERLRHSAYEYLSAQNAKKMAILLGELKLRDPRQGEWQEIKDHVYLGLERGFLAEYRAWLLTYRVYIEGGFNYPGMGVSWMNDLLDFNQNARPLHVFIFDFLKSKTKTPTSDDNWLFKHKWYEKAYEEVMDELSKKVLTTESI